MEIELLPAAGTSRSRAGYSANADIVVREKKDVLLLPERLVTLRRRQGHRGGAGRRRRQPVKKDIKVGLSDGINVEVADGPEGQDLVVERPPKKIE